MNFLRSDSKGIRALTIDKDNAPMVLSLSSSLSPLCRYFCVWVLQTVFQCPYASELTLDLIVF